MYFKVTTAAAHERRRREEAALCVEAVNFVLQDLETYYLPRLVQLTNSITYSFRQTLEVSRDTPLRRLNQATINQIVKCLCDAGWDAQYYHVPSEDHGLIVSTPREYRNGKK